MHWLSNKENGERHTFFLLSPLKSGKSENTVKFLSLDNIAIACSVEPKEVICHCLQVVTTPSKKVAFLGQDKNTMVGHWPAMIHALDGHR